MSQMIQTIHNRRVWLLLLPLLLAFTAPYVVRLMSEFFRAMGGNNLPPVPGALLSVITIPFVAFSLLNTVLLGQSLTYLLISAVTLVICLLIALRGRVGRVARGAALLTVGCILALPLVIQKPFNSTWLEEQGYTVHAVPSQQNFVDSAVDGLVDLLDGKACQYNVLGWSADNVLYYQADCKFGPDTYWRYVPALPGKAQQVAQVTDELVTEPESLLNPIPVLTDHRSPNGRWIASVWEKFSNEPENVIVVSEGV